MHSSPTFFRIGIVYNVPINSHCFSCYCYVDDGFSPKWLCGLMILSSDISEIFAWILSSSFCWHFSSLILTTALPCIIKPLQMIKNAAAHLIFDLPKKTWQTTTMILLCIWLPVAAHLRFATVTPSYLSTVIQVYNRPHSLCSADK